MKKILLAMALIAGVAAAAYAEPPFSGMSDQQQARSLQGQVTDDADAPLAQAIVYLKNTRTLAVKTYIADKTGHYNFNALSPNVDYEVYAEHNGKKSDTKTLSSFDSRKSATINLKVK